MSQSQVDDHHKKSIIKIINQNEEKGFRVSFCFDLHCQLLMLLESNDHDLADAQNTSTPTCTSFSPQQQHSSMNASSSGASSKVRVQQILLVLLLLLNAISWNFVLFWRHEAFDLRARVAELETECAAAHTAATVAMATAECPTVRTAVIPPLTKSAPPTATLPPHPHLSALIDKLSEGGLCPAHLSDVQVWKDAIPTLWFLPNGGNVRGELFPNASYKHFDTASGPYRTAVVLR
jgi:hypothetical protein